MIDLSRSIFERRILFSYPFLIKRDDLIHPYCNGNKARKFLALLDSQYAHKTWVSYGGNQSNAMFALAYLARLQGAKLHYVMPEIQVEIVGNLKYALEWGIQIHSFPTGTSVSVLESYAKGLVDSQSVFIPQGGDVHLAMKGINLLAHELRQSVGEKAIIFYTSGSGVGVIALQKALDSIFPSAELVVLSCAGSESQLRAKFAYFGVKTPQILSSPFAFTKPKREIWEMREYLKSQNLRCDLLYDSVGFWMIEKNFEKFKGRELVFIHSGGLMGDISQLARYEKILKNREGLSIYVD